MEALGLPSLNTLCTSHSNCQTQRNKSINLRRPTSELSSLSHSSQLGSSHKTHKFRRNVIKMQSENEDGELKQVRDMAAARKRWEALLREGKVKVLTPREAGYAIQLSNKTMLDVRPSTEREKAWVKGSTWIPIFDADNKLDLGTISRKVTNYMMGGWWSGAPTLAFDGEFVSKVQENFPKDTDLIVACQKGLRSLAACELLYNSGYTNLFWVQGGLDSAEEEDLVIEGPKPIKFAGIGGFSEFLGWTDQQRVQVAKEGWRYRVLYSARLVGVFLVADALFIGLQRLSGYIQDLRTH